MSEEKLNEDEKASLQEALKQASISDAEIRKMVLGESEPGMPDVSVDSEHEMVSAAADALDFVEGLDSGVTGADTMPDEGAVAGFDALLNKLETLRGDIQSLQRGVVGVFAAQLLSFRGKVVELKSRISTEMVEKLRMQFFKSFIESTFVEIVDSEFAALEKELVDKIVEQTQSRFKEFASKVRESEIDLRSTIVEQQDIVRSFMESLEEEATAQQEILAEKDRELSKLEKKVRSLEKQVDSASKVDAQTEELNRRIAELENEISNLRSQIFQKDERIENLIAERDEARDVIEELNIKIAETKTQLDVYREASEKAVEPSAASEAEIQSLESKIKLLENALDEKRKNLDEKTSELKKLKRTADEAIKEKDAAEELAAKRLEELESVQDRIDEVKNLEQKIYDLENELQEEKELTTSLEMQKKGFEKATRLLEKERDMALEERDLARERASRYIKVLNLEANTKVLLLVDEVGTITFKELGKSLGIPAGLAAKHARELEKLGVLKTTEEKAISTLKKTEIKEGEVDLD
ncbi:hypothetical protein EU537_12055 [Candidatus Thorarchaeota archaeon]|nr:MAG: hypothetical protein EU537_12055 [Candidatus Thorarchaeota archaeon]